MYLTIFTLLIVAAFLDLKVRLESKLKRKLYYFCFMVFWLLSGLRYETGVDWPGYTLFFKNSLSPMEAVNSYFSGNFEFELGYTLLNAFVRLFTDNVQWLFLLVSFITSFLLFVSLPKYSNKLFLSLLTYFSIFYFVLDMSGIRQCIALNIFLYSIQFIINGRFGRYVLLILIAASFHTSALILIPFYFILKVNFKSYILLFVSLVGMLISLLKISWISIVLEKIIGAFFVAAITGKLYGYGNREDVRSFGFGFVLNILILLFLILKRKSFKDQKLFNVFLNMYVVGLFFYYFTWELTEMSSRFRLYFVISNLVIFPFIVDLYKPMFKKYAVVMFTVCFSFFYCRPYILGERKVISYVPYQNYLIHIFFDIKSTGEERLRIFSNEME